MHNEGDIGVGAKEQYQIAYGALVPKRGRCGNLLVPVCVSSSRIAFGSIRMEPVFMILGQTAATAAVLALARFAGGALLIATVGLQGATVVETDLCVYGGTSGGVAAVVQATRMGKSVSLAVFNTHLGGLTSGGLGATDVGTIASIGGVSREFYHRIGQRYGQTERFNFEPHVAREVYAAWLSEIGVVPRWNQRLATVTKAGQRITQLTMEDGTIYRARMFIDATYEGDLMAMAGVSFACGRESTNVYGESLNGIRASTPAHQFPVNVDPYVVPGVPASGLLPLVQQGGGARPATATSAFKPTTTACALRKTRSTVCRTSFRQATTRRATSCLDACSTPASPPATRSR